MTRHTAEMDFTGERMLPGQADPATFWHHVYRYRFAIPYCRDRQVLDVASGEGYGCASLLKGGARSVIGVDISEDACRYARERYCVQAVAAPAERLPLPDRSLDVVVSFETIEHLREPKLFIRECARVLRPAGRLIISSPNRDLYRLRNGMNPFHCSEMSEPELLGALRECFEIETIHGQYPEIAPAGLARATLWPMAIWVRMKGINRFRRWIQHRRLRHLEAIPLQYTKDPALAVQGPLTDRGNIVNPNVVRPRTPSPHLEFVFLLVVARRLDSV
jgi:SAM-dependent methyltransferase